MDSKTEKKYFGIAEFEKEEKWLESQHKNGWLLVKTNRNKYQFEKCNADDWIYQIDFKENGSYDEEYIQMFKDCGWEYILQCGRWCYFRRKKEDNIDLSIFSDRFSRIDMYTRMLKSHTLIVSIVLFISGCIIVWLTIFTKVFRGGEGFLEEFLDSALPWIGMGLLVATYFSATQYLKLKRMVNELKSPEK